MLEEEPESSWAFSDGKFRVGYFWNPVYAPARRPTAPARFLFSAPIAIRHSFDYRIILVLPTPAFV